MPLDPFSSNSDVNDSGDRYNPEKTAKPEVIATRNHIIETAVKNLLSSAVEKDYVSKARDYARKFNVMGVEDWLKRGRTEFNSEEELHEWASDLSWPHEPYYYKLST